MLLPPSFRTSLGLTNSVFPDVSDSEEEDDFDTLEKENVKTKRQKSGASDDLQVANNSKVATGPKSEASNGK